ncbi:hypothetical protein R3P38DRAFT_2812815 [Favolaschia claudopus]|uniref:Uncharacterized protein n=1 Tax=Favolaschia claudopus TaxID=2862362 RepID=A0AAV9Z622_9AGAR
MDRLSCIREGLGRPRGKRWHHAVGLRGERGSPAQRSGSGVENPSRPGRRPKPKYKIGSSTQWCAAKIELPFSSSGSSTQWCAAKIDEDVNLAGSSPETGKKLEGKKYIHGDKGSVPVKPVLPQQRAQHLQKQVASVGTVMSHVTKVPGAGLMSISVLLEQNLCLHVSGAGPDGWGFPPQTPTAARGFPLAAEAHCVVPALAARPSSPSLIQERRSIKGSGRGNRRETGEKRAKTSKKKKKERRKGELQENFAASTQMLREFKQLYFGMILNVYISNKLYKYYHSFTEQHQSSIKNAKLWVS